MQMGLCQMLVHHEPHEAIGFSEITRSAQRFSSRTNIDQLLQNPLDKEEYVHLVERKLLNYWASEKNAYKYLDASLIAHADAALSVQEWGYDAAVAIKDAGVPYGEIFEIMGMPIYSIDYSHHRRNMKEPQIESDDLQDLLDKQNVLLIDVDMVTGKTVRDVASFLRDKGVNVWGCYLGLSEWPGMDGEGFRLGKKELNFNTFWNRNSKYGVATLKSGLPYKQKLIPNDLELIGVNSKLKANGRYMPKIARRVLTYLQGE